MAYIGKSPAKAPLTSSDITDNIITSAKIVDGTISSADLASDAVDLQPVRQDVLTLALKQAVEENHTKFNLPNSAIVKFEADADFNLAGSTTIGRNSSEYISTTTTITSEFTNDGNTLFLCNMNGSNDGTSFTDSSTSARTITANGNAHTDTTVKKFGTASYQGDGSGDYLSCSDHANWDIKTNWTIECWSYLANLTGDKVYLSQVEDNSNGWYFRHTDGGDLGCNFFGTFGSWGISSSGGGHLKTGTWQHVALTKASNDYTLWVDGASVATATNSNIDTYGAEFNIGRANRSPVQEFDGYIDDVRISDVVRTMSQVNATGTALGTTNVPTSAVTDVSGVMLLKNEEGTATLGTDVKAYFTADNSNWTEATSYADAGTFSTGIKMIKLGKTTCTSGSDVRWKIVFANQSSGSKETFIYGIGVNY